MEFIDAIKMTDLEKVKEVGLDQQKLAAQVADSFLAQILKTSYFHCDPHPGNLQVDAPGKRLVDALETMGVLAKGADRLSVEKLARYFIKTFKGIQQGKTADNIKTTLGADLQALTEQQVFRFPSTF